MAKKRSSRGKSGEQLADAAPAGPGLAEHLRGQFRSRLEWLLTREEGTRSGDDPEDLHQMRVSVRRLRALLRAARPLLEQSWSEPLRAELGWLGRALGDVRDLDVLIEHLRADSADLPEPEAGGAARVLELLDQRREAARSAMLSALDSARYRDLVETLQARASSEWTLSSNVSDESTADALVASRGLVERQYRRLRKAVKKVNPAGAKAGKKSGQRAENTTKGDGSQPSDAELHRLRILGKRLRYTAELARSAGGEHEREIVRAAKSFQDVLGAHQDAHVAENTLRELVDQAATPHQGISERAFAAWLATGRLLERQRQHRRDARAEWWAVWRRLKRLERSQNSTS